MHGFQDARLVDLKSFLQAIDLPAAPAQPVCRLLPRRVGDGKLSRVAEDRRFAEAVYKVGLATGVMDRMRYLDLDDED